MYDGESYEKGTLLNITSKGECYLYKCIRKKFRKMSKEIIQYCDEPCEMGWLPGCCMCKKKSEFAFISLLKSYISEVVSYISIQNLFFLFSFSIPPFSFSITSLIFQFPVFTLRFPLIVYFIFFVRSLLLIPMSLFSVNCSFLIL